MELEPVREGAERFEIVVDVSTSLLNEADESIVALIAEDARYEAAKLVRERMNNGA